MADYLVVESLDLLINAVREYQIDLQTNQQILLNAANACDAAMGSDDISKKHIARLHEALGELQKTADLASEVIDALLRDRSRALDTYTD